MLQRYFKSLQALARRNLLRDLSTTKAIDFSSNDYLAFSIAPFIRKAVQDALDNGVAVGSTGSRLLRGNHEQHLRLEEEAAIFFGAKRCLYMGSGYMANLALLSTLPQQGDLVIYDAFIHASCHDGMRLGKAETIKAIHNDPQSVDDIICKWRNSHNMGNIWIIVESLYSMGGDKAPLADLIAIANKYNVFLIIDEAHATGVYGFEGRGLAAAYAGQDNVIHMHTCGKSLGVHGALILVPDIICNYIINRTRTFIYTTAPSPLMAVAVRASLSLLQQQPEYQFKLKKLIKFTNQKLFQRCGVIGSGSQIIPIIIGSNRTAMELATELQQNGFDIRAIRQPTVPLGKARLRITVTLHVDQAKIIAMLDILAQKLKEIRFNE